MIYKNFRPLLLLGALGFLACQEANTDRRTVLLEDTAGKGYAASNACSVEPAPPGSTEEPAGDCLILPNPDGCAFIEWSEEHTITTDASGNIIKETYTTCTQCLDENTNPIGDPECSTKNATEPVACSMTSDGCWACTSANGEVTSGGCERSPVYCSSDEQCKEGEICEPGLTIPGCDDTNNCPKPPPDATGMCTTPVEYCYADSDCDPGEICQFGFTPCPDGEPCPPTEGKCTPEEALPPACLNDEGCSEGEYCKPQPDCPPGEDCPAGGVGRCAPLLDGCEQITDYKTCIANPSCQWSDLAPINCPEGELCTLALCEAAYEPQPATCESFADEQGCSENSCQWNLADPACLGGPSAEGCPGFCTKIYPPSCYSDDDCSESEVCQLESRYCPPDMVCAAVMVGQCVPAPDECSQITEQEACAANSSCGWFAFGMPCIEGEPCISGVCQTIAFDNNNPSHEEDGCDDGATPTP